MILADSEILKARERGDIVIEPFARELLGSNSYDVHLGRNLLTYKKITDEWYHNVPRDVAVARETEHHVIGRKGFVLQPGILYLGVTEEYTETHKHVPNIDGKSSTGRDGIQIHLTAGRGDVGFCGHWTLEICVVEPVRVRAGMLIGQLTYQQVFGVVERPYNKKPSQKYTTGRSDDPMPIPSSNWKNFKRGGPN